MTLVTELQHELSVSSTQGLMQYQCHDAISNVKAAQQNFLPPCNQADVFLQKVTQTKGILNKEGYRTESSSLKVRQMVFQQNAALFPWIKIQIIFLTFSEILTAATLPHMYK
jgi:hypothetical protein